MPVSPGSPGAVPDLDRWSVIGIGAGALGILASIPGMPGVLVGAFVLVLIAVGPGAAVRAWVRLSPVITALTVPAVGAAAFLLLASLSSLTAVWAPEAMLLGLSGATIVASGARAARRPAPSGRPGAGR